MTDNEFLTELIGVIIKGLSEGMTVRRVMKCLYIPFSAALDHEFGDITQELKRQLEIERAKKK